MVITDKTKKIIDYTIVILVFALTGSTVAYLSGYIMSGIGVEPWTFGYVVGYIFLIFPLYQLLILGYGAIFGKFSFFYERQKKIVLRIGQSFKKLNK